MRRDYLCGIIKIGGERCRDRLLTPHADGRPAALTTFRPSGITVAEVMHHYPVFPDIDEAISDWYDEHDHGSLYINLQEFCNPEPYIIGHKATLARTYRLFLSMGLRCLPVINGQHQIVGVVTRQNLLPDAMHRGIERAATQRGDDMQTSQGFAVPRLARNHSQRIVSGLERAKSNENLSASRVNSAESKSTSSGELHYHRLRSDVESLDGEVKQQATV